MVTSRFDCNFLVNSESTMEIPPKALRPRTLLADTQLDPNLHSSFIYSMQKPYP